MSSTIKGVRIMPAVDGKNFHVKKEENKPFNLGFGGLYMDPDYCNIDWNGNESGKGPLCQQPFVKVDEVGENIFHLANGAEFVVKMKGKFTVGQRFQKVSQKIPSEYGKCAIYTSTGENRKKQVWYTVLIHGVDYKLECTIELL